MSYTRFEPSAENSHLVECYWVVENDDASEKAEKIIPDGFPEIIFHLGDPYRIKLKDDWREQSKQLFAGQIKKYFFLQSTGTTYVLGVKLKPAAATELFNLNMHDYTDEVVDLHDALKDKVKGAEQIAYSDLPIETKIKQIDHWLSTVPAQRNMQMEDAIAIIFESNGLIAVGELCSQLFITERQLERLFKRYIGLSPKFYCRIIRFNYIFSLMQNKTSNWTDIALESGYYDSSHFIKNFKAFTGEDPSQYFFEEKTMANFFLQKRSL